MLLELKVSNFAIIENLHINFKNGLNILSGETGAGKIRSVEKSFSSNGRQRFFRYHSHGCLAGDY